MAFLVCGAVLRQTWSPEKTWRGIILHRSAICSQTQIPQISQYAYKN